MPSPILNFRLPASERAALFEMARVYGAPNASVFLREMVGAMCSGDEKRVSLFLKQLFERITGQLTLDLAAAAKIQPTRTVRTTRTTRGARKQRKQRRTHARTT